MADIKILGGSGLTTRYRDMGDGTFAEVVSNPSWPSAHLSGVGATTTVKSGAGVLHAVTINTKSVGGTATVYDSLAGSGTVLAVIDTTLQQETILYDIAFAIGLTIVTADGGATHADLTVSYA